MAVVVVVVVAVAGGVAITAVVVMTADFGSLVANRSLTLKRVGFAKTGGGVFGRSLVWLNRRSLGGGGLGLTSISTGDSGGEFGESGILALDLVTCWFTIEPFVDCLSAIVVGWDSLDSLNSLIVFELSVHKPNE